MVGLSDRRAVSRESLQAALVGFAQGLIHLRRLVLYPRKQRRTEIEADLRVVVYELHDPLFAIQNSGQSVRRIALGGDSFVPVMIWIRGILQLDGFERGVLSRRLVEMSVDANVAHVLLRSGTTTFQNQK